MQIFAEKTRENSHARRGGGTTEGREVFPRQRESISRGREDLTESRLGRSRRKCSKRAEASGRAKETPPGKKGNLIRNVRLY